MRLEELVLDGFKSYPVRTVITGWDGSFNAITGLNGSGKSNILDAICFVLGITNLTSVRAANLQDLIYKRGQAGITKASVTIMFDNSDRSKSPVGFENYKQVVVTRQVAMGGTSKYLICGHRATQQSVQNLFQSVGLNINNPNFLIMQGKITKVLNMKAPEILGLIEEAAGTSMFEERKDKANKTMTKKEKKIQEIQELLREEIEPKLNRLREEKRVYLEFQKTETELERLSRMVVAYDWTTLSAKHQKAVAQVTDRETRITEGRKACKRMKDEVARMTKEIDIITKKIEKERAKGGKLQSLETRHKELNKELGVLKTKVENKAGSVKEEQAKLAEMEQAVLELKAQRESKIASSADDNERFDSLKTEYDVSAAKVKQLEELLQTLITGMSSSASDSTAGGYMGQLATAKSRVSTISAESDQAKVRIGHLNKELKEKAPQARKAEAEGRGLVDELARARAAVTKLEGEISASGFSEEDENRLTEIRNQAQKAVRELTEQRDSLRNGLGRLDFQFSDPVKGFDRSKVKGLVANLISLDEANAKAATALEVAAGGRLYNVVVENEKVGGQLLESGRLQQRVTIIPLNQVRAFVASAEKIASAKKVAPGKADLALSLVGYADEVSAAMQFVFGSTFICTDAASAKAVAFANSVRMKCVTLEGDVYNPSGTLEGGSAPNSSQVLIKVQQIRVIEEKLAVKQAELNEANTAWDQAKSQIERANKARKALDLKKHEVSLLEGRIQGSSATRIISEVEETKKTIAELTAVIDGSKAQQKEAEAECKRLEKEMEEFKNNRDSKLNELKSDIKAKKADLSKQTKTVQTLQREVQIAKLELEQMVVDIRAAEQDVTEARKALAKSEAEVKQAEEEVTKVHNDYEKVNAELQEEKKQVTAFDEELKELDSVIKSKESEIGKAEAEEQKLESERENLAREVKSAEQQVRKLKSEWEWIQDEKESFGQSGTPYDFTSVRISDVKKTYQELNERHQGMRKKVNPKVLTMIDSVEKKEKDLLKMYQQVLKDKSKIEETIAKLDDYKRDALKTTWEKVNGDFGNIFAELLPGNFAKLEPPEGQDITQGLEVKIRLGQVWKASLTELSGGQRSLIALSLIMSLLQFKPAPMYILDEVDAALDLSHTQHIGQLFRNRFKGSQFIVVSLKEGLFTNANVLFRARFRDGTSIVERTAQRTSSELYADKRPNKDGRRIVSVSRVEVAA